MSIRIPVPVGHLTWHMTATEVWEAQRNALFYRPEAWDQDGFIHCTDDPAELLAVGNRYYQDDARTWIAVHIKCDQVSAPMVYEDAGQLFPHIYGLLPVAAATERVEMVRDELGSFVAYGKVEPAP